MMPVLRVEHLTLDYLRDALGIDRLPQLGWRLVSDERDVRQVACRVQIATSAGFESVVWDSGEIAREDSMHFEPDGLTLEDATRYWWRVWVQAAPNAIEVWSESATFVTAYMRPGQWTARFISAEGSADGASSRATCVRKSFVIDGEIESAYAFTTALGVYQMKLDGAKVGSDELAPGWTSYHKHLLYQTYDITAELTPGEHTIEGWLGVGWYKGLMGFFHNRNNYGDRTAFFCQIEIVYKDGRKQRIITDESWTGFDTPILFSDIYDGETYDARLGLHAERQVATVLYDMSVLQAQPGCRIKIMDTMPAQEMIQTPNGEMVLDFGQNLTGWVRFSVQGQPGDVVQLQCFEVLDVDGNVYTDNLRDAKQTITYTIGSNERETYQPHFTFQGFRYVHVVQHPGRLDKANFAACVVHSDMEETGTFACSNPLLNQLWHNIQWGLKGNFLDVPTDCPQRDERMGWTGDAQIFAETANYIMNAYPFFDKWLSDLAADQTPEGGVPHVVPDIVTGRLECKDNWLLSQGTHSGAAWADAAVIIPWDLYRAYGDTRILHKQYDSMKAWVEFMRAHAQGCVWTYELQFGDWVALDAAEGSYYGATPNELVCAAYYAYSTKLMAKAARVLGNDADACEYRVLYEAVAADFQARFFLPDGSMAAQTQTAHILALHFDLVPEAYRAKTADCLQALIEQEGGHLVTGFVGTPYIAHALSENGKLAQAYDLVLKDDFPSWLYQVKMGATTVWEHWDGIKPDGSMWSADMNSFNHYAYGAVGEWLYKVVGGIRLDEEQPGYRHAVLMPRIGGGLTNAQAGLDTVYGRLSLAWSVQEEGIRVDVEVPCNTTATLALEGSDIVADVDNVLSVADGRITGLLGSGKYSIVYRA